MDKRLQKKPKKLCPKCNKMKSVHFFAKKIDIEKYGDICYHCYRKMTNTNSNKHYETIELVDSKCPYCGRKHRSTAKYKYCPVCIKNNVVLNGVMNYL